MPALTTDARILKDQDPPKSHPEWRSGCENIRRERCRYSVPANPDAVVSAVPSGMQRVAASGVGKTLHITQVQ